MGGDEVALEFFGATTSWRSLDDQVSRLAQALRHRYGVRPGDRVALLLPNSPQHVIAFYAVLRIGAVVVEHNPLYTASELGAMFADHGATVAIAWDVAAPKIADAGLKAPHRGQPPRRLPDGEASRAEPPPSFPCAPPATSFTSPCPERMPGVTS